MAKSNSTQKVKLNNTINKADEVLAAIPAPASEPVKLYNGLPEIFIKGYKPSWQGGKVTDTEAREMVAALKEWASEHLPDHNLYDIAKSIENAFIGVWTEIDEALLGLSMFESSLKKRAPDMLVARPNEGFISHDGKPMTGFECAKMYLHRWQDRGGAIGNVAQSGRADHPMNELKKTKERLSRLVDEFNYLVDENDRFAEKTRDLLNLVTEILPKDMGREKLLVSTSIELLNEFHDYVECICEDATKYMSKPELEMAA